MFRYSINLSMFPWSRALLQLSPYFSSACYSGYFLAFFLHSKNVAWHSNTHNMILNSSINISFQVNWRKKSVCWKCLPFYCLEKSSNLNFCLLLNFVLALPCCPGEFCNNPLFGRVSGWVRRSLKKLKNENPK